MRGAKEGKKREEKGHPPHEVCARSRTGPVPDNPALGEGKKDRIQEPRVRHESNGVPNAPCSGGGTRETERKAETGKLDLSQRDPRIVVQNEK